MSLLQVSDISRQEEGTYVLKGISFTQELSQKIAIAGATGSGKTTLLKIIAGLVQPHEGRVLLEGERVIGPDEKLMAGHPRIAYLSQHFELRNNYRVRELLDMANHLSDEEAGRIYAVCRIQHLLNRGTHQLSGGEKQRIALARLLVAAPSLLLLDEPYSNLDAIHKNNLKYVVQDISEELRMSCIVVSHDPIDVLSWADQIIVLKDGRIVQKGEPEEVYNSPLTEYAAALFGKYNALPPSFESIAAAKEVKKRFLRPEHFRIIPDSTNGVEGKVTGVLFTGPYYEVEVVTTGHKLTVHSRTAYEVGTTVYVSLV